MHVLYTAIEPNDHVRENMWQRHKHEGEEENMTQETDNCEEQKSTTQKQKQKGPWP
jgi:hypothetical protein